MDDGKPLTPASIVRGIHFLDGLVDEDDSDDGSMRPSPSRTRKKKTPHDVQLLHAGLTRNIILVSLFSISIHSTGARAIPNVASPQTTIDVVWLALTCAFSGVVQIIGVQTQINEYIKRHRLEGTPPSEVWIILSYLLMLSVVIFYCIVYPIFFVVIGP